MIYLSRPLVAATNELIDARLGAGAAIRFRVPTRSMYPTLAPGDLIVARQADVGALQLGDVVLLKEGDTWIVHRLVGWRTEAGERWFLTKGDNLPKADPTPASHLYGVVETVERRGRYCHLLSPRARWLGRAIAHLSLFQSQLWSPRPSLVRRLSVKSIRAFLLVVLMFTRRMVG
jgi:signal peptidase I